MDKDAKRQHKRRLDMRKARKPDTHAVDRAVSQAVARLSSNSASGEPHTIYPVWPHEIVRETTEILKRRYGAKLAEAAITERIRPRSRHLEALPPLRERR